MSVRIGDELSFEDVSAVALEAASVDIAPGVAERMAASRRIVEEAVAEGRTVYGITTGIGQLANVRISPANAERVQRDIVRSHAVAVGPALSPAVVRAMLLLRARTFAFGISGVRFELVERLTQMLNAGLHPIVPAQGSLGASGDLALLSAWMADSQFSAGVAGGLAAVVAMGVMPWLAARYPRLSNR